MARYSRTIRVPHTPDNLFDLVADIARYPDFIRWIKTMRVSGAREVDGARHYLGEARVGFAGLTETFATNVVADPGARTIETRLVRGPFRKLHNTWRFAMQGDGSTEVVFGIEYEFKNFILQALMSANFDRAVNALIGAFLEEADRRYVRVPVGKPEGQG